MLDGHLEQELLDLGRQRIGLFRSSGFIMALLFCMNSLARCISSGEGLGEGRRRGEECRGGGECECIFHVGFSLFKISH
jgi:hypothetical protein